MSGFFPHLHPHTHRLRPRLHRPAAVDLGKGMGEMGWWCLFVLGILLVNLLMNTMRQSVQCFEKVHDIGLADFYALVGVHVLA